MPTSSIRFIREWRESHGLMVRITEAGEEEAQ